MIEANICIVILCIPPYCRFQNFPCFKIYLIYSIKVYDSTNTQKYASFLACKHASAKNTYHISLKNSLLYIWKIFCELVVLRWAYMYPTCALPNYTAVLQSYITHFRKEPTCHIMKAFMKISIFTRGISIPGVHRVMKFFLDGKQLVPWTGRKDDFGTMSR